MKTKICDKCKKEKVIWKNHENQKFCKECWLKFKYDGKFPKIKQKSKKRLEEDKIYFKLREVFLNKYPICQVNLPKCTHNATEIHHIYNGENRRKYFLDTRTWISICRNCHNYIHFVSPEIAREKGLLK